MKIMAVDLGKARTGIAVCDESEMLASPVTVIHEHNGGTHRKNTFQPISPYR